jgi:hypothetical protein
MNTEKPLSRFVSLTGSSCACSEDFLLNATEFQRINDMFIDAAANYQVIDFLQIYLLR